MMELLEKFVDAICRIAAVLEASSVPGECQCATADKAPEEDQETPNETGPEPEQKGPTGSPKSYKQLVAEKGLPYLKSMCTARGLAFKAQARENTIIALLETDDARNPVTYGKVNKETTEEPGPFDAPLEEEITDNDPLGLNTPPEEETPEVTPEDIREVLTTIIGMKDGGAPVVEQILQDGAGVVKFKNLDPNDQAKLVEVNRLAQDFLR